MLLVRAIALAATLVVAAPAAAHKPPRVTAREFVRLAGSFVRPEADASARQGAVALSVQGRSRPFAASAWQVFALVAEEARDEAPAKPAQLVLQGPRELLARVAGARPEQRVVLLAERRPGAGEVFLLAVDLCPAE